MFRWLLLAAIVAVGIAGSEVEPAEAVTPLLVHRGDYNRDDERHGPLREYYRRDEHRDERHDERRDDRRDEWRDHRRDENHGRQRHEYYGRRDENEHDDRSHNGPNIIRLFDPSRIAFDPHNQQHKKIIEDVYSPDYVQPTWILDYRYQKTGGRDYTRADGGQVLILPKNVHSHEDKQYKNYDELLEFLRLKKLSESQAHRLHHPEGRGYVWNEPESHKNDDHRDWNREHEPRPIYL